MVRYFFLRAAYSSSYDGAASVMRTGVSSRSDFTTPPPDISIVPLPWRYWAIRGQVSGQPVVSRDEGFMTLSGIDAVPHLQWHLSPLERLRHSLTEANLARHWGDEPCHVLDVAGGNGVTAVRLATQGHEVTVLDPAGAMLNTAIQVA